MRTIPPPLARRAGPARPRRRLLFTALMGLVGLLGVAAALFTPRTALAFGSVTLANREPVEVDGRWKLDMKIDYGSIPLIPHVPVIFSFQMTVLYERALLDKTGDKPQLVRKPLQDQPTINEAMAIDFADASGKVFKVTKFDFAIKRDHGFEAGEYDLKIKREDDGAQLGQTIKLVLKGDNEIVDRRAINFSGDKPKKKDGDKMGAAPTDNKDDAPDDKKADAPDDKKAAGDEGQTPPPVEKKQGGCGCRVAGDEAPAGLGALVAAAAVAAASRRRRR